jgi:Cation efflux family
MSSARELVTLHVLFPSRSRFEVVGGFVNAVFLICIALAIVLEGVERLFEPPEINSDNLLMVSPCLLKLPLMFDDAFWRRLLCWASLST